MQSQRSQLLGSRLPTSLFAVLLEVLRRPSLWGVALLEAKRFVPDGWLRRRPFLPLPDAEMLRFRVTTQYGDPDSALLAKDVIAWLRWCKIENRRRCKG